MLRLSNSKLFHNLLMVGGGSAAAQAVVFIFSPLITRIYSPEVFGMQGIFLSLVAILGPASAARYPMAIVLAKDEREVHQVIRISFFAAAIMFSALSAILFIGAQQISRRLGDGSLGSLIWFLPLAIFLLALQEVNTYCATRNRAFRLIGVASTLQALVVNLAKVLGGLIAPVGAVLVAVTSLGPLVLAFFLWLFQRPQSLPLDSTETARVTAPCINQGLSHIVSNYRDLPLYRVPSDIIYAAARYSPVIVLAQLSVPEVVGFFVLASSVLNVPFSVIGSAAGQVLYQRYAELASKGGPLFPLALKLTLAIFVFSGAATLAILSFLPTLFEFVFGKEWHVAGVYSQWLALWGVCMLSNIPSVQTITVIRKQNLHLLFNVLLLIGSITGILLGFEVTNSSLGGVAGYALVTAIIHVVQVITYLIYVRRSDLKQVPLGHG